MPDDSLSRSKPPAYDPAAIIEATAVKTVDVSDMTSLQLAQQQEVLHQLAERSKSQIRCGKMLLFYAAAVILAGIYLGPILSRQMGHEYAAFLLILGMLIPCLASVLNRRSLDIHKARWCMTSGEERPIRFMQRGLDKCWLCTESFHGVEGQIIASTGSQSPSHEEIPAIGHVDVFPGGMFFIRTKDQALAGYITSHSLLSYTESQAVSAIQIELALYAALPWILGVMAYGLFATSIVATVGIVALTVMFTRLFNPISIMQKLLETRLSLPESSAFALRGKTAVQRRLILLSWLYSQERQYDKANACARIIYAIATKKISPEMVRRLVVDPAVRHDLSWLDEPREPLRPRVYLGPHYGRTKTTGESAV